MSVWTQCIKCGKDINEAFDDWHATNINGGIYETMCDACYRKEQEQKKNTKRERTWN